MVPPFLSMVLSFFLVPSVSKQIHLPSGTGRTVSSNSGGNLQPYRHIIGRPEISTRQTGEKNRKHSQRIVATRQQFLDQPLGKEAVKKRIFYRKKVTYFINIPLEVVVFLEFSDFPIQVLDFFHSGKDVSFNSLMMAKSPGFHHQYAALYLVL